MRRSSGPPAFDMDVERESAWRVSGGGGMATDNDRAPYVISGVMADGAPYTANGTMQPDGSVLFRVPHRARVKDFPSRTTDQRSTFS